MRSLVFEGDTWLVYEALRQKDAKQHRVLCRLLKEMLRGDRTKGTGKPEPLKHQLSGLWSRRLSQKDRLIYKFDDRYIYIFASAVITIKCEGFKPIIWQCWVRSHSSFTGQVGR